MPIWSFTQERLDRLKEQIAKKKSEHDDLEALSEKDLWCRDLDEFEVEWNAQLALDAEIKTNIRRMGRRVSKKIGAGRGRKPKATDDDDFAPVKSKAAAKPKKEPVTKTKTIPQASSQRFAEKFAPAKKTTDGAADESDAFSDDDFAILKNNPAKKAAATAPKSAPTPKEEESEIEEVPIAIPSRSKRAAAAKAKSWVIDDDESESEDDDNMLGDVGALVKGIPGASSEPSGEKKPGRLSLFAMSRPESSHDKSGASKSKAKSNRTFDFDSNDDTNYEMLAKSSPHKTARNEADDFLSDEDDLPVAKPAPKLKSSTSSVEDSKPKAPAPAVKKAARGRPAAAAKGKTKEDAPTTVAAKKRAASKPVELSPAAKLYAKKKGAEKAKPKKGAFDLDDDEDEDNDIAMADPESPPPRPAARGRPGRAAAVKKKPVYVVDDDDDDEEEDVMQLDDDDDDAGANDNESDDFGMDDSE